MLQSLHEGVCWRYVEGDGEYVAEPVRSKISNLRRMTLREFLSNYQEDMSEYYGDEFWTHEDEIITLELIADKWGMLVSSLRSYK